MPEPINHGGPPYPYESIVSSNPAENLTVRDTNEDIITMTPVPPSQHWETLDQAVSPSQSDRIFAEIIGKEYKPPVYPKYRVYRNGRFVAEVEERDKAHATYAAQRKWITDRIPEGDELELEQARAEFLDGAFCARIVPKKDIELP